LRSSAKLRTMRTLWRTSNTSGNVVTCYMIDWLIDFVYGVVTCDRRLTMLLTDIAAGRSERPWYSSFLHIAKHVKSVFRLCPESKTHIINKSQLLAVQGTTARDTLKFRCTAGTQKGAHLSLRAFLLCLQSAILKVVRMSHGLRPCRHKMALLLLHNCIWCYGFKAERLDRKQRHSLCRSGIPMIS